METRETRMRASGCSAAVRRHCATVGWKHCLIIDFVLGFVQTSVVISLAMNSQNNFDLSHSFFCLKSNCKRNETEGVTDSWLRLSWEVLSFVEIVLPVSIVVLICIPMCICRQLSITKSILGLCILNSCLVVLAMLELFIYSFSGIWLDALYRKTARLPEPLHTYPALIVAAIQFATLKFVINVLVIYGVTYEAYKIREEDALNFSILSHLDSSIFDDELKEDATSSNDNMASSMTTDTKHL